MAKLYILSNSVFGSEEREDAKERNHNTGQQWLSAKQQ